MKHLKSICCAAVCFVFSLLLCACHAGSDVTSPPQGVQQDAVEQYALACNNLTEADALKLNIIYQKSISSGQHNFQNSFVQTLSYSNTGSPTAHTNSIYNCGQVKVSGEEFYQNNIVYTSINGERFCSKMDFANFLSNHFSPVLFTPANYQTVFSEASAVGTYITFDDALSAESYIAFDGCIMRSANGSAMLDHSGNLLESTYCISYTYQDTTVEEFISLSVCPITTSEIEQITQAEAYRQISDTELPYYLEFAAGYVGQAQIISSTIEQICQSELTDLQYTLTTQIDMDSTGADLAAQVVYTSDILDFSRNGESTQTIQSELLQDGVYHYTDPDGTIQSTTDVSESIIKDHILELLVQNIITTNHIADAAVVTEENAYHLHFVVNDEMAQILKEHACQILAIDNNLLDTLAQSYRIEHAICSLTLDRISSLPLSITISYHGEYEIEGQVYPIHYELQQDFSFHNTNIQ